MSPIPADVRQLLLVLADDWGSIAGSLVRFVRAEAGGAWQAAGQPLAVSLGRAGLAWGRGWQPAEAASGPRKREGDGRAPAGVFPITALFGQGGPEGEVARSAKLPYLQATADLKCVDDPASRHYNRVVDQSRVVPDWQSCEDMQRGDHRYEVGAVLGCNCEPVVPGAGSCLFLHVWAAPGAPTAGCTAMAREDMLALARWLDGRARPVLVQLPRAEYGRLRDRWGLPLLTAAA